MSEAQMEANSWMLGVSTGALLASICVMCCCQRGLQQCNVHLAECPPGGWDDRCHLPWHDGLCLHDRHRLYRIWALPLWCTSLPLLLRPDIDHSRNVRSRHRGCFSAL